MAEKRFPLLGGGPRDPVHSIPWSVAADAWQGYKKAGHGSQSLARIAERGGFSAQETACALAGHYNQTDSKHKGCMNALLSRLADDHAKTKAEVAVLQAELEQAEQRVDHADNLVQKWCATAWDLVREVGRLDGDPHGQYAEATMNAAKARVDAADAERAGLSTLPGEGEATT